MTPEEIGQRFLSVLEDWKLKFPENKNVNSDIFVNEILYSGIIPDYLTNKHADKSRYQQYGFTD